MNNTKLKYFEQHVLQGTFYDLEGKDFDRFLEGAALWDEAMLKGLIKQPKIAFLDERYVCFFFLEASHRVF